jgi:branched-chain amino acid transport system ATP-binding protein
MVHYGKVQVVRGISMEVGKGDIVAVIGANGAGKTTLLRTISGLKGLTSGEIYFKEKRIDGVSPDSIVKMGMAHVPQGRKLFPYMTTLENLEMGAFTRKESRQVAKDLDEVFRHFPVLKARKGQLAVTLSGGEQQMLAIGRALMSRPNMLLLDEPTLGLSPMMVREIGKIITDLNSMDISIVLVEQNARLALRVSYFCFVLERGKILVKGYSKELSSNEYVKKAYLGEF